MIYNFSKEIETDSCLSFLDINITRRINFVTSIFRKPTFSGVYLNFKSHAPLIYKKGLITCLLHRIYTICSSWEQIHNEINHLKCVLIMNKYPYKLINNSILIFLDKVFVKRPKPDTVPKRQFTICLPFLGTETLSVKRKLKKLFSTVFPAYDIRIVLSSGIKIGSFLNFKDKLSFKVRSFVVYKFTCGECNVTYIGKTKRHLKVRMCEHLGISYITGKPRKFNQNQTTAVREHLRECGHKNDLNNFKILTQAKSDSELIIKESLLIGKEKPPLNKQVKTYQLSLF